MSSAFKLLFRKAPWLLHSDYQNKVRTLTNKCFRNISQGQVVSCNNFTLLISKMCSRSPNLQSNFELVSCSTMPGRAFIDLNLTQYQNITMPEHCKVGLERKTSDLTLAVITTHPPVPGVNMKF